MSLRRFAVYFFTLCACATAAFASHPSPAAPLAPDNAPPAASVALAR